jgi:DNA-directed RNA polymerase specialized sigma24 family protein
LLLASLRDRESAENLTQDCFVRAYRARAHFRGAPPIRALGDADRSERQRTVFLLRFVEDLDLLEIAAITGMKEGTVKAHLFRALQSVRARLKGRK